MSKVCMVEYQGRCDENDKAIGHSPKVLRQYYNFIKKETKVSLIAPKVILNEIPEATSECNIGTLDYKITMRSGKSIFQKIKEKVHMFSNIKAAIKGNDADYIWFFNVEYYLMLYLYLHKKPKNKIVCTFFLDRYKGGIAGKIKQHIFEKAQKKIDFIVSTGASLDFKNCKYEYIPDYYYEEKQFEKLRTMEKQSRVVCLGTMHGGKLLEDLVSAFNKIEYPLYIAGRFFDKGRFERLKAQASKNVTIEDKYLSDEEYFEIMASSKYTVLPYNKEQYNTQTSGVMQEAVFTDSVVVTYGEILDGNKTPGVKIDSFESITDALFEDESYRISVINEYDQLRKTVYDEANIKNKYLKIFEK